MGKTRLSYNIIDPSRIQNAWNAQNDIMVKLPIIQKVISNKYFDIMKYEADNLARHAIDAFYDAYDRHHPEGTNGDLYNAYKIIEESPDSDGSFLVDIDMGFEYMHGGHHQSNEFVYVNSFEKGYHGGSFGVDKHGEIAAEPYFRDPMYIWSQWQDPAPRTEPPRSMIINSFADMMEKYQVYVKNDYERIVGPLLNRLALAVNTLLL